MRKHDSAVSACCFTIIKSKPLFLVYIFALQEFSNWPTIPQLYVDGEFTGGADILIESFQSGELKTSLEEAGCTFVASE